jgi:hypothetical protein
MSGRQERTLVGWREWATLPDLGTPPMKAKIDTGARTSALHVSDLREREEGGRTILSFVILPVQRSDEGPIDAQAPLLEYREVRPSSGRAVRRPVISTTLAMGEWRGTIELTLADRDQMGFRMLLGRTALRSHFLVDPAASFLTTPRNPAP